MIKTAIITGKSGFIGQHLEQSLLKQGVEILPFPRHYLYNTRLTGYFLDYFHPDYIYHLASYGNMSTQTDERQIFEANLQATFNLLAALKQIKFDAFVNVSSSSVLLSRETMYSLSKRAAERICLYYASEYRKPIVTVRPYSVYGPGEADFRFIPTVVRSCLRNEPMTLSPDASHDWIYIDDLIEQMQRVKNASGATISIGTGKQHTNLDVVTRIEKLLGKKANITEYRRLRSFDDVKWGSGIDPYLLDYANKTTLTQGLKKTVAYYKKKYDK